MTEIDSTWWILPDSRRVCMPASSGMANGRAIARLGEMVASGGEVGGRRYLSREVIDLARAEHAYLEDPMFGMIRWGLGLAIDHPDFRAVTPDSMHWGGFGGSYASMDPARGLSVGFAPSKLRVSEESAIEEERLSALQQTLMSCVRHLD